MLPLVGAVVAALALGACAKEEAPPGALPDQIPPTVVEIRPRDGTVVPDLDDALKIRFNEPVEENRRLRRTMVASPAYRYRVEFGFSDISVEPEGGWRPGAVYTFRLPPPVSDLLGNRTETPIEVTFSTGPEITGSRVEGTIRDRVTGEEVRDARALFYRQGDDSIPYTAVQDTGGRFRLESLPPGEYEAWGFRDLNANRRLEAHLEAYDSATFVLDAPEARASLALEIVEPDSTPPLMASVTARDSLVLALQFDDPLDPEQDFGDVRVVVRDTTTGEGWPVEAVGITGEQVGRPDLDEDGRRGPRAPGPDTALPGAAPSDTAPPEDAAPAADTGRAGGPPEVTLPAGEPPVGDVPAGDTGGATEDSAGLRRDTAPARPEPPPADTAPRPSRLALVRLGRPLEDGGVYRVEADSFRNLRKLHGGGDTVFVYTAPRDTAARDTAPAGEAAGDPVAPDSAAPPPDSAAAGRRRDVSGKGTFGERPTGAP